LASQEHAGHGGGGQADRVARRARSAARGTGSPQRGSALWGEAGLRRGLGRSQPPLDTEGQECYV